MVVPTLERSRRFRGENSWAHWPSARSTAGYELGLALIAGFLVALFVGPGAISADRALGLDRARRSPAAAM